MLMPHHKLTSCAQPTSSALHTWLSLLLNQISLMPKLFEEHKVQCSKIAITSTLAPASVCVHPHLVQLKCPSHHLRGWDTWLAEPWGAWCGWHCLQSEEGLHWGVRSSPSPQTDCACPSVHGWGWLAEWHWMVATVDLACLHWRWVVVMVDVARLQDGQS